MAIKRSEKGLPVGLGMYWKGRVIYAAVRHRGIKHVICCGTDDADEALRVRNKKLADLINHDVAVKIRGVLIGELFDDYVSHLTRKEAGGGEYAARKHEKSSYKSASRINANLRPYFGKLRPEDLTDEVLQTYKAKRLESEASVVTVNSEFRLLRAALRRGVKASPRKVNPFHIPVSWPIDEKAEKLAAKEGTISDEQYAAILAELADHMKPVFALAQFTGARAKELKFIRRDQVDFDARTIKLRVGETKNGEPRLLPLNDHVFEILSAWEADTRSQYPECPWLLHYEGKQLGTWRTAWEAALRRVGLRVQVKVKGEVSWKNLVTFHDTRRTMVTSLEDIQDRHIQKVSGHKTVSMVRRYDQSRAAEIIRTAQNEQLAGRAGKSPAPAIETEAPAPVPKSDWRAELKELKELLDAGLLPEDIYKEEVQKVMAKRGTH